MNAPRRYGLHSLRFKLVLASVVVEVVMLVVLVWNSTRVSGNALADIFQERIDTLVPMLNVNLTNPLIQRDYATLDERLGRIVRPHSLVYIEVRDELGNKVASRGEVPQTSQLDESFKVSDHVYDQAFDITLAERVIGRARYGLNVNALEATLASLRNQGAIVASVEIVLTVLLLATLGALLTRRLQMLAQAARALSGGDYAVRVPTAGQDEVADAARAFNAMTEMLVRDAAVRKQSEVLLSGEKRVLEMIAEDAPLSDILEAITRNVEAASNQTLCSILLLDADGVHLRHGAAPSLPVDFSRAVHGEAIGPQAGSCGTAVYRNQAVIVSDIAIDALWTDYRALALSHGLRACWSTPIRSGNEQILGSFALYYREPRAPGPADFSLITRIAHLSAIAIERSRANEVLQQSEQRLRNLIDGLGAQMFVGLLTPDGTLIEANQPALVAAGLKPEDVLGKPLEETYWLSYSKAVQHQTRETITRAAEGMSSRYDLQIRVGENQFIIIDFSLHPLLDEFGKIIFLVPSGNVITERKRAEEALRISEASLNEAQRNAQIGNWHYLPDGTITWSDQMYELFKLPRNVPLTYDAIASVIHPEDRGSYNRAFMCALESGAPDFQAEYRVVWPNGQVRTVYSRGKIRREVGGRVIEAVGTVQDVTERKRIEDALRTSEERLRLALDAARMGTFDWDMPNNRITWSYWHEALWGFKPGEFDGTYEAFSQRVHRDDLPGIDTEVARCIAQRESFVREFRVVWPDGSMHWIATRGEFTFGADGLPLRMRGAVLDITERMQAEMALRQSEDHFRTIFEQATDGILVSDAQGNYIDVNSTACKQLGYRREEMLKLNVADAISPDELPRLLPEIARLEDGQVVLSEWRMRRQDGSIFLAEFSAKQLPDGRLQVFLRDITERRQAEDALQALTRELEQRVVERTAQLLAMQAALRDKNVELESQYRQVQEANRLKSEFLANMSHELRTPLNAIIGFSELMHDGRVGPVSAQHQEYLGDVLTSAKHLLQLINDVLDLAKVEAGKLEFSPEPVDLGKTLNEVRDVVRALVLRKHMQVTIEVEPSLTGIVTDPAKLKQILYNYLSNAIKFSHDEGEVTIRAGAEGDRHYRIEVEDHGIGIKSEDMERLFGEFQQLDAGAGKKHTGTGLGLALTKRVVEAQGGRVGVTSRFGQGSLFYAVLPRVLSGVIRADDKSVRQSTSTASNGPRSHSGGGKSG